MLDQFPRNIFRGDGRTHAEDDRALGASRYAVEHALDRELPAFQRMFLYMPFMHSESMEDQRRSVELFERLAGEEGAPDVVTYAVAHRDIVEQFGTLPAQERDPGPRDHPRGGCVPYGGRFFFLRGENVPVREGYGEVRPFG